MGFGNIGIGELMVILLVVMIIFGPKRLPEIARNMGKFMRDFRRETSAAITELKQGIEPVRVGIFDEPDGGATVATPNGEPMPGVAAAGGAGTVPPMERPVAYQNAGNGAGHAQAKPKPRAKKPAAKATTAKRKTATSAKKRPASKAKRPATKSGGTRKR